MDPLTFALGLFGLLVGGGLAFAKHEWDNDETTPGTPAYYNKKQLDLAQSNLDLNEKVSQQNFELSKEQFEYQKQLNQTVMDREDTAFERQVEDLKNAGLSPLNIAGGSPATALTSANAPQKDISGINQAIGNMLGAYNDVFNRKMNVANFRLQNRVSTAQIYNQLLESKVNRKYLGLQYEYLKEKLDWEKTHGFRDLDLSSEIIGLIEKYAGKINTSSVIPGIGNIITAGSGLPKVNFNFSDFKNDLGNIFSSNSESTYKPSLPSMDKVIKDSKKLDDNLEKRNNRAFNLVETRSNKNDQDLLDAIDHLWKFSDAPKQFEDYISFKSKILNDYQYRKNIRKYINIVPRRRIEGM